MTQITLNGKNFNLAHHLGAEMAYYDLTGHNINPSELFASEGTEPNPSNYTRLLTAHIVGNEQKDEFDVETDLLRNTNRHEVQEAIAASLRECVTYYTMPAHSEDHVPEPVEEDECEKKD